MRKIVVVVASVLALAIGGQVAPSAAAQPELPGGMSRFVVSVGSLSADSRENWVRLGSYSFGADGTVTESHFHWSQRDRVRRS
ncbi:MAG: hypothetical protein GEU98_06095 [Pseudonocardiaceae bacterium]|nr:hypothetical protein [Pseudonocardiaceae bacterium]